MSEVNWRVLDVPTAELGEGPIWDAPSRSLIWVDITGRLVHRHWPDEGTTESYSVPSPVGSVCLAESGDFVLALEDGFWFADERLTDIRPIARVHQPHSGLRFNDGKCDPGGRFWAGTMAYSEAPSAGALYRLDGVTATPILRGVGISNGIDWSPDARFVYYVDSPTQTVQRYEFDTATGAIGNAQELVRIDPTDGLPDGLTVDAEGHLWLALWNGACVRRYTPSGVLERELRLPVSQVTSCTFGGPDLDQLFVTTAAFDLSAAEHEQQPLAGAMFEMRAGVRGIASRRCRTSALWSTLPTRIAAE
jgi:sugar lactone lactonase YvrE